MIRLLDTNTCIRFLNDPGSGVGRRMTTLPRSDLVMCDIVKAELYFGAEHSARPARNLAVLDDFFSFFRSLPFDGAAARAYGSIRSDLAKKGTPIGPNDLLIAATAVANEATLVTHNTGEFSRVLGLALEDWET